MYHQRSYDHSDKWLEVINCGHDHLQTGMEIKLKYRLPICQNIGYLGQGTHIWCSIFIMTTLWPSCGHPISGHEHQNWKFYQFFWISLPICLIIGYLGQGTHIWWPFFIMTTYGHDHDQLWLPCGHLLVVMTTWSEKFTTFLDLSPKLVKQTVVIGF